MYNKKIIKNIKKMVKNLFRKYNLILFKNNESPISEIFYMDDNLKNMLSSYCHTAVHDRSSSNHAL